jgi:fumarylacetoacetase
VPVPQGSPFPLENLPYGSVVPAGAGDARIGVRLGDHVVDLRALHDAGLLDVAGVPAEALRHSNIDRLLALEPPAWAALRSRLRELLGGAGPPAGAVQPLDAVTMRMPFTVADYVDFYASEHHAANLGRMLRPGEDPLTPNWRHLPIGYHGRRSTIRVSGAPVARPAGQLPRPGGPVFGPTERLDIEVELGAVIGGPAGSGPLGAQEARARVFGYVIVNDWSARDIQAWEYRPLGPFLGKSFATSISPWVVTAAALAPQEVPAPPQHPEPLPHLRERDRRVPDIALEVAIAPAGRGPVVVARTSARHLYWTVGQQIAHLTSNGCSVSPGDLYASGTISGPGDGERGSLIELTWNGAHPIDLGGGVTRTFLEDGDTVTIRGVAGGSAPAIGLGEVVGTIAPQAPSAPA